MKTSRPFHHFDSRSRAVDDRGIILQFSSIRASLPRRTGSLRSRWRGSDPEVRRPGECFGAGSPKRTVKWKWLPWPGSLSTQMRPPISSAKCFEISRPTPAPVILPRGGAVRRRERIEHCARFLDVGIPMPVSLTVKRTIYVFSGRVRRDWRESSNSTRRR